jgi:hypothetical protein
MKLKSVEQLPMIKGVFAVRVLMAANKLLHSHEDQIRGYAESVQNHDVCVGLRPYNGLVLAAALTCVMVQQGKLTNVGGFSATKYFDMKKGFSEDFAGGFDGIEDILRSDLLIVSELSYVSATVAVELDAVLYRRFCSGMQTIITGYNMPVESGFSAETIDGFGGYPLLANRLHETVVVLSPELPDECFR